MEYIVYRIFLDMHTVSSQVSLRVKKGDTSRKISATLREGGKPYQIADDCYAVFSARKPDGNYIYNDCLIEGNTIVYTFTEQTVPVEGTMDCEIVLYNGEGQVITSPRFTMIVEDRVYNDEAIVSSPEANAFVEMLERTGGVISDAVSRTNEAISRADAATGAATSATTRVEEAINDVKKQTAEAISGVESKSNEAISGVETQANEAINRVYGELDIISSSFANAFKGSKSGAIVQMDDVSPVEHIVGCKVSSKNLFNTLDDYNGYDYTYALETLTVTGRYVHKFITLEEGKTYTFSCKSTRTGTEGGGVYISAFTKDKSDSVIISAAANINIVSPTVTITVPAGYPIIRFTLYGYYTSTGSGTATYTEVMLEEGSEATGYVPYVDPASVTVKKCGKNLASPNLHSGKVGGYTYTPNDDGSITISGAATTTSQHVISLALKKSNGENESVRLVPNQTYTLTIYKDGVKTVGIGTKVEFDDGTVKWGFDKVSTKPRRLTLVYVQFTPALGDTEYCGNYRVQLELGDTATPYEKYVGGQNTVVADGTANGMTSISPYMTIFTDTANTLVEVEYNRDSNKVYEELLNSCGDGGSAGPAARIAYVNLLAKNWVGSASPYSQVVTVEGVTPNSQVDLTPSVAQLAIFYNKDLAFVTENEEGVVTVYAIGQKPANDYTIQATITEVIA